MQKAKVFIDSSVFIAAAISSRGGSFYILSGLQEQFEFITNQYVFDEVIRVLDSKFAEKTYLKNAFFLLFGLAGVKILPNPSKISFQLVAGLIEEEDIPILVSASDNCTFLVTLDDDFFDPHVIQFASAKNLHITKPKDFILRIRNL